MMVNGFGTRWIDFHDRREDGSALATQWIMLAFFPLMPRRRARLRVGPERTAGVPGVAQVETTNLVELEQLPIDETRNGGVYGFYYGVFLPLVIAPTLLAFAIMIAFREYVTAGVFWSGFLVWMACGIGAVALERRRMGPPRPTRSPNPEHPTHPAR